MSEEEKLVFDCPGCGGVLYVSPEFIGDKIRCGSCDLAMLVPDEGQKPSIVDESSAATARGLPPADPEMTEQEELAKLPRLETRASINVEKFNSHAPLPRKKLTDTLTTEELLETTEVEALSRFAVYAPPAGRVAMEAKANGEEVEDLPEIRDSGDHEEFSNLLPEDKAFLKPKKVHASKTIRGGRRPPRVEPKKKLTSKVLLILVILFGVTAGWYFMNKDNGTWIGGVEKEYSE